MGGQMPERGHVLHIREKHMLIEILKRVEEQRVRMV